MRNDRSENDRRFPNPMEMIANSDVRPRLLRVITGEFAQLKSSAEVLARASLRTPRAARNWLDGQNAPDAVALIELMAASNAIADEVNALVAARRQARQGVSWPGSS